MGTLCDGATLFGSAGMTYVLFHEYYASLAELPTAPCNVMPGRSSVHGHGPDGRDSTWRCGPSRFRDLGLVFDSIVSRRLIGDIEGKKGYVFPRPHKKIKVNARKGHGVRASPGICRRPDYWCHSGQPTRSSSYGDNAFCQAADKERMARNNGQASN